MVRKVSEEVRRARAKGSRRVQRSGLLGLVGGDHFSRECPTGDGGRGGMKGGGKDHGKAITCFNFGGVGHRAAQCPTSVREVE